MPFRFASRHGATVLYALSTVGFVRAYGAHSPTAKNLRRYAAILSMVLPT